MKKSIFITVFLILLASYSSAQAPFPHSGLVLCQQGKYAESILPLENATKDKFFKNDAKVWNCLSIAYLKGNDLKRAQKGAEKATELEPNSSAFHSNLAYIYLLQNKYSKGRNEAAKAIAADPANLQAYYFRGTANLRDMRFDEAEADAKKIMELDATFQQAYLLLSEIYMGRLSKKLETGSTIKAELPTLKASLDALQAGKEHCKGTASCEAIEEEYASTSAFYKYFAHEKTEPLTETTTPDPSVTPLRILTKPRPGYTDKARSSNVSGTVLLAALFGVDGRVWYVMLLHRLGGGLDEQAIAAAKKIQFEPMKRDGKPVPVVKTLEYTFSIY